MNLNHHRDIYLGDFACPFGADVDFYHPILTSDSSDQIDASCQYPPIGLVSVDRVRLSRAGLPVREKAGVEALHYILHHSL